MNTQKADIISRLKRDILSLQGLKKVTSPAASNAVPGAICTAFPNAQFPLAAVHEFFYETGENGAATAGFVSAILASLMNCGGACLWISSGHTIFPSALKSFGIDADRIIFIDIKKEKEILWVMEESLKCEGLAAVVGEMRELSFIASRRLQLAVEESRVTGFVLRHDMRSINTTACVTRWKITSLPSELAAGMPGVGFPRWNVELLKVRNGLPGSWEIEFAAGRLHAISKITAIPLEHQKKTG